ARILYQGIVTRTHEWKVPTHLPIHIIDHTWVERFFFRVAKDFATELSDVFGIICCRPAFNKSLAQVTAIGGGGNCCGGHCCCSFSWVLDVLDKSLTSP